MGKFEDLTGKKFGKLTVLYRAADYIQPSGQHKRMWHCICDCGSECDVRANDIKSGNTTSCGCLSSRKQSVGLQNLVGKIYGDFIVINRAENRITPSGQQTRRWICRCRKCGIEKNIAASQLKTFSGNCSCTIMAEREKKKKEKQIIAEQREKKRLQKEYERLERNRIKEEKVVEAKLRKKITSVAKRENEKKLNELKKKELQSKLEQIKKQREAEMIGKEYGILNVEALDCIKSGKFYWTCKCKCGNQKIVSDEGLLNGSIVSCGCLPKVRGESLQKGNPELAKEWHPSKNGFLTPSLISINSGRKIWWVCSNGHPYEASPSARNGLKTGCPYCSTPPKKIWSGYNDLATTDKELAADWHPTKNGDLTPDKVFRGSAMEVWWKPQCGHEFKQKIVSKKPGNCPYCSRQKLLKGFNDFATTNPEMLSEWDYEKNKVLPSEIGVGTHIKIWWKCPFGHSYQAQPSNRCGKSKSGCPICDKENHTSFPEQAVLYYVQKYIPDAINSDRKVLGMELDIYIPSMRTAIEYDGKTWHRNNKYELKKNVACKEKNIKLIRIRESGLKLYDDCICIVRHNTRSVASLEDVIIKVFNELGIESVDVNVNRDEPNIHASYIKNRKSKSLARQYKDIASEWHPEKNGSLKATMVAPKSNKKVWWLGKCGHEWIMSIQDRVEQNCSCPYCSGKRVLKGFNDFASNYPELLKEWDFERNSEIVKPDEVAKHSDKKVWWLCSKCGNRWQMKIDHRTRRHAGCPECAIKIIAMKKWKKVKNTTTGEEYVSLKEAEEKTGINRNCISNCCRGKQKRAGKFTWEFVD